MRELMPLPPTPHTNDIGLFTIYIRASTRSFRSPSSVPTPFPYVPKEQSTTSLALACSPVLVCEMIQNHDRICACHFTSLNTRRQCSRTDSATRVPIARKDLEFDLRRESARNFYLYNLWPRTRPPRACFLGRCSMRRTRYWHQMRRACEPY